MGIKPATALKIALFASPLLILWSVLPWANIQVFGDFGGGGLLHVPGTNVHNVVPFGDGVAVVYIALMSILLAGCGLYSPSARRISGFGVTLAGAFVCGIAAYDIVDVGGVDLYPYSSFCCTAPQVHLTTVPYVVAANGLIVALAGLFALLQPGEKRAEERGIQQTIAIAIAPATEAALRAIVWASLAMAVMAFLPWLDSHTLAITTGSAPVVMTALSDAVLFASVALVCAFFAWQMMRAPSELVWAGLAIAGGVMFVIAGSEIVESTHGCTSNGTILGLMNTGFFDICSSRGSDYELSAGTAVGWIALVVSATVALLGLALPIIEAIGRTQLSKDDEVWA